MTQRCSLHFHRFLDEVLGELPVRALQMALPEDRRYPAKVDNLYTTPQIHRNVYPNQKCIGHRYYLFGDHLNILVGNFMLDCGPPHCSGASLDHGRLGWLGASGPVLDAQGGLVGWAGVEFQNIYPSRFKTK